MTKETTKEKGIAITFSPKMISEETQHSKFPDFKMVELSLPSASYRETVFGKDGNGLDINNRKCVINVPAHKIYANKKDGVVKNLYMYLDKAEYKVYPKSKLAGQEDGVNIYDKPQPFMLSKEKLAGVFNEAKTIAKENKQRMQAKQKEVQKSKSQDMSR